MNGSGLLRIVHPFPPSGATQKGRTGHRWFTRGEPPPGRCGKRFLSTDLAAAVRPGSDDAFALALLLDQAGWHGTAALRVPDNVTLLPLPSYSPACGRRLRRCSVLGTGTRSTIVRQKSSARHEPACLRGRRERISTPN